MKSKKLKYMLLTSVAIGMILLLGSLFVPGRQVTVSSSKAIYAFSVLHGVINENLEDYESLKTYLNNNKGSLLKKAGYRIYTNGSANAWDVLFVPDHSYNYFYKNKIFRFFQYGPKNRLPCFILSHDMKEILVLDSLRQSN